ncbi:MAG: hypothetical protein ACW99Q_27480 [Candidatus Kariarchaeaceae archaeon]
MSYLRISIASRCFEVFFLLTIVRTSILTKELADEIEREIKEATGLIQSIDPNDILN